MGLFDKLLSGLFSAPEPQPSRRRAYKPEPQPLQRQYEPQKWYTLEEMVIHEQEQSGAIWHGVRLSDLSRLAQNVYHGKYVKVDEYNFLEFYYTSNSGKTTFHAQCDLDENGQLSRLSHNYYPGQWRDSADTFIEQANQMFTFS